VPEQPVHFDGLSRGDIRQAPELGADGADILREFLNMDETQISALTSAGIV
jgi:CoA:oxalate CoA-transferase